MGISCQAPTLGSFVHHVSVPRLVADTHTLTRLISKTILLLLMGRTWYMVWVHMAWATGLISYIRVLRQQSYINVAPFLQAAWSADVTLALILIPQVYFYLLIVVVLAYLSLSLSYSFVFVYTLGILFRRSSGSSILVCPLVASRLKSYNGGGWVHKVLSKP
jgi:hypothetical protein